MDMAQVEIGKLKPHPKNPRIHDETIPHLVNSIKRFGFKGVIVAQMDGTILAGHARWKAARKVGMKTVPVIYVDMEPKEAEAFLLADNKVGEHSDWETSLLVQLAQDQKKPIPGFVKDELSLIIQAVTTPKKKVHPVVKPKGTSKIVHKCPKCKYKWSSTDEEE